MNLKTFLFIFILGLFISCSSNRKTVIQKEPIMPPQEAYPTRR